MAEVRLMTEADIPAALSVWKDVGLSEGTQTLYSFHTFDPEGMYVALHDGKIIGTCAAIINNPDLACIGLYAVSPSYQGKGIGSKVWKEAFEHVSNINCFLNSVPDHLSTYRDKAGFVHQSQHQTIVCESPSVSVSHLLNEVEDVEIKPIKQNDVEAVIRYDTEIAGHDRSVLVRCLITEPDSVALMAVKNQEICGYGCLKDEIKGMTLVGPLYACSPEIAELLLRRMVELFPSGSEKGLIMMAIDANPASLHLVDKLNLKRKFTLPRIFTKSVVEAKNYEKVYGQCNINFSLV